MIDLTSNERQKDYFVTKVIPSDDYKLYTVYYASGRKEIYPFSVHNFNVDINHMEREYYTYKDNYKERISNLVTELQSEKVRYTALSLLTGVLMYDMINKPILKILAVLITLSFYMKNNYQNNNKQIECNRILKQLEQIKRYIKNKEKLKVSVIDPVFKDTYDWYLFNLSNVENTINSPDIYDRLAEMLTPEMKEKLGDKMTRKINGEIIEEKDYTFDRRIDLNGQIRSI